ncbi:hypothetical protein ACFJIX_22005 [Roseateles sp. UC29_93]|uniref:hypothetical protein n=1 Tax=Roseateles sp. UC29_93 TaxID=3350177 RepID=UPI0036708077
MYNHFGSTSASSRAFPGGADESMFPSSIQITELPDDAEVDDGKDAVDKDSPDVKAFLSELKAKQHKEQARLLAGFRRQIAGQQEPSTQPTLQPTLQNEARHELLQAQKQLRAAQQQLKQAYRQVHQLQRSLSPWSVPDPFAASGPWAMPNQWAMPNRWTRFDPYGCSSFGPRFHPPYAPPFASICSPYGMSFADRCAFSPFDACGAFGSTLQAGLAGLIGFELGAALF